MDVENFKRKYLPLHAKLFRIAFILVENKEDAEDILQEGIVLCGGGANLTGLGNYISKFMQMRYYKVDDPQTVVSRGGMYFLENSTDFAKMLNVINYK